ncbi:MAG TPA: peptidoglycan DD-metalloendopeptidase family protein [Rhodospirillales bacterium]
MLMRGLLAAAALAVGVAASAALMLDLGNAGQRLGMFDPEDQRDTLSLAPLSLGNPSAAATLRTRWSEEPQDGVPDALPPSFQYVLRVGHGDTLGGLLIDAGVPGTEAEAAIRVLAKHYNPRRIRNGQEITVIFEPPARGSIDAGLPTPGRFLGLTIEPEYDIAVEVVRAAGGGFAANMIARTLTRAMARAAGEIDSSLYIAGRKAGLPHGILAELIRAFSWDVDFQRDVREGDGFEVMYDRAFDDRGREAHAGPIRFAALTLSGKRHAIYLHTTADGDTDYFDAAGKSARKALMRTPIDGARLSSGFGKRMHPILGYTKVHRGVDFAAPSGTPIYAAGSGAVVQAGPNGAYGNYLRIRHNGEYSTAYAHLRAFAKGVRAGKRVTQGQIIGYVGTTGRSTGPHLHYEILVNGTRTNPMKVRMPSGRALAGAELKRFEAARARIENQYAALPAAPDAADARLVEVRD